MLKKNLSRFYYLPALLLMTLVVWGLFVLLRPSMPDLSYSERADIESLLSEWRDGDLIVVMRHLERCDRYDFPCLRDDPGGITARSVSVAQALREDFFQLGLNNADIYYSPMTRTAQTSELLFDQARVQDWLYQCRRAGDLFDSAIRNKSPGRNLVLVTHSSCIDKFENALGFDSDLPQYGASIFVHADDEPIRPRLIGFVDPDDWDRVFAPGNGG